MKTVFVLFDSLNRLALGAYGSTVATPNFDRFAQRAVTFDNHYVGFLPCMPARRDMTGRLNFTHCNWGPLEPFDESFARQNSVYTHLISELFRERRLGLRETIRGQEYDALRPPIEVDTIQWKTGAVTRGNCHIKECKVRFEDNLLAESYSKMLFQGF